MHNYTFTVKLSTEDDMRAEILEVLVQNTLKDMNVNALSGTSKKPCSVEVKGKKS